MDDTLFGLRGQNELNWDENGDGGWSSNRWLGVGPDVPSDFDTAIIRTDRVVVSGNRAAFATIVESGALSIDGALTSDVTVDPAGSIVNRGTIAGDLDLQGQVTIEELQTLVVDGTVLVEYAGVSVDTSYSQPRGTYSGDFVLVDADVLVGTLAQSSGDHLDDGFFLESLDVSDTQLTVHLYSALPGDADGDGIVDGLDFVIWNINKFQTGTDWTSGDFNGDGITDGTDFVIWNEHKFTSADRTQFVPEPQAWMLLLLATFGARTFVRPAARNLQLATGRP